MIMDDTRTKSDKSIQQLEKLREDTLEVLGEMLRDLHLARLAQRFAEVRPLFERLDKLSHQVERRPVQPFYNAVICGASNCYKTTSLGDVFPEIRDPWLVKDAKDTTATALSIEPSSAPQATAFAHFYDDAKLRALVEREAVQEAHRRAGIQVEDWAKDGWRFHDGSGESAKLLAKGGMKRLEGVLAREFTTKQFDEGSVELDGFGRVRTRELRFLVEKIQIEGHHRHLEELLGEHRSMAERLHVVDTPGLETAFKDRDGALRVLAQRKPAEILRGMLEDDKLDVLVLFVRTGDEAKFDKVWAELNDVQAEDVGLDNRLFIALTGFHAAADDMSIAQADKPVEKIVRANVLSTLGASRAVEPAGVSFLQSLQHITDSTDPDLPEHRAIWEEWWSQKVKPVVIQWRDEFAELYEGAAEDFDANLRALADPADGGVGHLFRTIARHLERHGVRQKLDKHLVRGGLCESLDQGLVLLERIFDDHGEPRRDLLLGPAHRLRDLVAELGLSDRELAAVVPEVPAEGLFSDFLTGERDSLRKGLVDLLARHVGSDDRIELDSLVTRSLESYLEVAGQAEPPACSTPHESRHWAILARSYAANEIVHQLAGGFPISIGSATDAADSSRPMRPARVLDLREELNRLREWASRLAEGTKGEG